VYNERVADHTHMQKLGTMMDCDAEILQKPISSVCLFVESYRGEIVLHAKALEYLLVWGNTTAKSK
jgi:hypothetical protein